MRARSFTLAILIVLAMAGAADAARLKADYEEHPALLIGCANLLFHHPQTLLELSESIHADVPIYGLVSNQAQADSLASLLRADGQSASRIRPIIESTRGMWVRDYGPIFVVHGAHLSIIDTRYAIEPDDEVPMELGSDLGVDVDSTPLWAEGGQLVHNGAGLLLASTALARLNAGHDGLAGPQIVERLQQSLPFAEAHWIEPLPGEPTGHLDMFLAFIGPDRLVVASVDPDQDARLAGVLDETARSVSAFTYQGRPLQVLRVPTPPPSGDVWFTYTNVILIGDQVIVPQYPEVGVSANRAALEFWRGAMPDREVVGVDASSIIRRHGSLHCISIPLPVEPRS